ncbi:MAG: hypothetical protein WBL61_01160, partial [Bryobacteraceae bacterium]
GRHELCAPGRHGEDDERHRMGAEDEGRQSGIAEALQERIAGRCAVAPSLFKITLYWKRNPISGSSFDWKMLLGTGGCI